MTPEQYLELERAAEFRHGYHNGDMYPMPANPFWHAVIGTNLNARLGEALHERSSFVAAFDMRTLVASNFFTYPDVVVTRDDPKFLDRQQDTLLNPALIAEVLSPSTEAADRGFKFEQYRKLESLQEYALVRLSEARIEVFRRQACENWVRSEAAGHEAVCLFESVECGITLADVYAKVIFEAAALRACP